MQKISENEIIVRRSEKPEENFLYTPSILCLPSGRLVLSLDVSDKQGEILVSDDGGKTFIKKAERIFTHARLFADDKRIYLIGHKGDLKIFYSDDEGETWSDGAFLTNGQKWHQSACSVCYSNGYIYLVMERVVLHQNETFGKWWTPNILAPVVMRGKLGADLTKCENWLFSNEVRFRDVIKDEESLEYFGVPYYHSTITINKHPKLDYTGSREDYKNNLSEKTFVMQPSGWLETNIVQITDPNHIWFDSSGKTFHLFMRSHTGGSGYCCVMKAVEKNENGKDSITVEPVTVPSGKIQLFLPLPGGQMKFYVKYDEVTKLYWLLSTQAVDTMCKIECLDDERYNIPCDERNRLVLYFSGNMVDWCFAGFVAKGETEKQSRHYGSMDIDGDDLVIVSRSGDSLAFDAHCTNLVTLHRVKNFRSLVY